jgi:phosphocarrier protein
VKLAEQFEAEIFVERDGQAVSGRSIMGLMMLAAGPGSPIGLKASGPDAVAAVTALALLVERKFDED